MRSLRANSTLRVFDGIPFAPTQRHHLFQPFDWKLCENVGERILEVQSKGAVAAFKSVLADFRASTQHNAEDSHLSTFLL
jgi:hypothetical protein